MSDQNFTISITVDQTPEQVFDAIKNVRGWWSEEIKGDADKLGAEFEQRYKDVHRCKLKVTEYIPAERVVWHVVDNYFDFVEDKSEWKDTDIRFEISKKGDKTELRFTHDGLVPEYECYDLCSNTWGSYINGSLRNLIIKGKGSPTPKEHK